jgi:hypothetical protein
MAEETVVKEPLTEQMIVSGEKLIERLHAERFDTASAFWLFTSETSRWYLVFASPNVQKDGPLKTYGRIQKVLAKMSSGNGIISLLDVKVVPSTDPLVKSLRKLLRSALRGANGSAGVRVTRNRVADTYIEDAYVYRAA